MPETAINSDYRQRRAPFCVLLPILTIPFGVISATALLPPSASGQYVFFFAMLFRVVLFPLAAIALILGCVALFRSDTYPIYRFILIGLLGVIVGALLTMSGYHYGPGP